MAFPVSLPDDGLIDVMAMPLVSESFLILKAPFLTWHQSSRKDVVAGIVGASKGDSYWSPKVRLKSGFPRSTSYSLYFSYTTSRPTHTG
jgi:sphingosine kinase